MAAAKPALVLSKYDFETFANVLRRLDESGALINGTVETNDTNLAVRFNDDECLHEVTGIEALA